MMFRVIFVAVFLQLAKSTFARPGNLQSPPPPGKSGKAWMTVMWLFFAFLHSTKERFPNGYRKFGNTEGNL